MLRYREIYGTFHPPNAFVVPWTDDFPEEMWGFVLGETVSSIRTGRSYLKRREELEEMGFSYLAAVQVRPCIAPVQPLSGPYLTPYEWPPCRCAPA